MFDFLRRRKTVKTLKQIEEESGENMDSEKYVSGSIEDYQGMNYNKPGNIFPVDYDYGKIHTFNLDQLADAAPPDWNNNFNDEATALNLLAIHMMPRLTALQPGILRELKKRLRKYNVSEQAWR